MPPAAAAGALVGGGAAMGIGGGLLANELDVGKSKYKAQNFKETGHYDANRYEVGGRAGVADEMAGMNRNRGEGFNAASHGMIGEAYGDRLASGQARDLSLEARGRQSEAQNLMIDRARGRNLISTQVANRARTDLGSRMSSSVASARGPAGLANAQTDAMAAQAQGIGQINQQEQTASMQEQQAAEQAAFGAASGMREGDTGMRAGDIAMHGQSLSGAAAMGGLGAQYSGLENNVRNTQMTGNLKEQEIASGSQQQGQTIDSGTQGGNASRDMDYFKTALGGAAGGQQAAGQVYQNASDPLAKTGILGLGAPSAGSGPAPSSIEVLGPGGGMDVNASSAAHGAIGTQFASNAGASPMSDPRAKAGVRELGDTRHRHMQLEIDRSIPAPSERRLRDPESFKRDTPAMQRQVAKKYDDDRARSMMAEADALIAAMQQSKDAGATLATRHEPDIEIDDGDSSLAMYPPASDPRAKEEAFRLGMQKGAAYATKEITGEDMQPWDGGEQAAPAPEEPPVGFSAKRPPPEEHDTGISDISALPGWAPAPAPHPLPPPPASPGARPAATRARWSGPVSTPGRARPPSDPRAKELGGVHSNEVAQTLDATPAVSYRYKDEQYEPEAQHPGERQAGFLTTDLKKTPLGAAVVEKRPDGLDGYNEHRLNGLQHAEIRNLHERLRELEALVSKGGAGGR